MQIFPTNTISEVAGLWRMKVSERRGRGEGGVGDDSGKRSGNGGKELGVEKRRKWGEVRG